MGEGHSFAPSCSFYSKVMTDGTICNFVFLPMVLQKLQDYASLFALQNYASLVLLTEIHLTFPRIRAGIQLIKQKRSATWSSSGGDSHENATVTQK